MRSSRRTARTARIARVARVARVARFAGVGRTLVLLLVTACGASYTAQRSGTASVAPASAPLDVTSRTIGPAALQAQGWRSLADAIRFYWPNVTTPPWRSPSLSLLAVDPVGVYANGARAGTLESLRDVSASQIVRVRRVTPVEEQTEFGQQHPAGALVIEWRKPPR